MIATPVVLETLLADYPGTHALRSGALSSSAVRLDFADIPRAALGAKRAVRDLEFDVAELAIVTYLMAKAHGKPLTLLPATVVGRYQHPFLACSAARGSLAPSDLRGKRVAVRSYSVTTAVWLRGVLADDYGVDPADVTWITFEDGHVAEAADPPNAQRAPAGATIAGMLESGEVDAAIVGEVPTGSLRTLIPDAEAAGADWGRRHGALQINHMVVVRNDVLAAHPGAVRETFRLLQASNAQADDAQGPLPFGVEACRPGLELIVDYTWRQGLIPRRYAVDELFDDTTRQLGA